MSSSGAPGCLFDVNVLVALALSTHVHHRAAHEALRTLESPWFTCPVTEAGAVRLLLNPRVTGRRFEAREVLATVVGMRGHSRWAWCPDDSSLTQPTIDTRVLAGHQQVTDLHLVNLAAAQGLVLATFDAALLGSLAPADRRHVRVLPQ